MKININWLYLGGFLLFIVIIAIGIWLSTKKQRYDMTETQDPQGQEQPFALSQAPSSAINMELLSNPEYQQLPQAHPPMSSQMASTYEQGIGSSKMTSMEQQYGQQAPTMGVYNKLMDPNPATNSFGVGQGLGPGGGNQLAQYEYL